MGILVYSLLWGNAGFLLSVVSFEQPRGAPQPEWVFALTHGT